MSETRSVQLTRVLDAPIDLVFRVWTQAEHVTRWMKCDRDVDLTVENWVPAAGARFATRMSKPGQWEAETTGTFIEVGPPRLLVYETDPNPALGTPALTVRVELEEVDQGTRVTLTHSGIPTDELCGVIQAGWGSSLQALSEIVGERRAAS